MKWKREKKKQKKREEEKKRKIRHDGMINSRSRVFFCAWPEAVRSCFDPNRRSYVTDAKLQPVSDSEPTLRTMFTRNVCQPCLSFFFPPFFLSSFLRSDEGLLVSALDRFGYCLNEILGQTIMHIARNYRVK